jgi:hypothetical protein
MPPTARQPAATKNINPSRTMKTECPEVHLAAFPEAGNGKLAGSVRILTVWLPRSFRVLAFMSAIFLATLAPAWAGGIAIVKEKAFHADKDAKAIVYSRIIRQPGSPFVKIISGGRETVLLREQLADEFEGMTAIPNHLSTEEDMFQLRICLQRLEHCLQRYPQSRPLVAGQIESLKVHVANFDKGMVRHDGRWMPKAEYARIREQGSDFQNVNAVAARLRKEKRFEDTATE